MGIIDSSVATKDTYNPYKALCERIAEVTAYDIFNLFKKYVKAEEELKRRKSMLKELGGKEALAIFVKDFPKFRGNMHDAIRRTRNEAEYCLYRIDKLIDWFYEDFGGQMCEFAEVNKLLCICTPPAKALIRCAKVYQKMKKKQEKGEELSKKDLDEIDKAKKDEEICKEFFELDKLYTKGLAKDSEEIVKIILSTNYQNNNEEEEF